MYRLKFNLKTDLVTIPRRRNIEIVNRVLKIFIFSRAKMGLFSLAFRYLYFKIKALFVLKTKGDFFCTFDFGTTYCLRPFWFSLGSQPEDTRCRAKRTPLKRRGPGRYGGLRGTAIATIYHRRPSCDARFRGAYCTPVLLCGVYEKTLGRTILYGGAVTTSLERVCDGTT